MPDRLTDEERETVCRALGFNPTPYVTYKGRTFRTTDPIPWITKGAKTVYPPIDSDDAWARKAMEAATRKAGVLKEVWFATQPPLTDDYDWGIEIVRGGIPPKTVGSSNAPTFHLALSRALLEAVKAGVLS